MKNLEPKDGPPYNYFENMTEDKKTKLYNYIVKGSYEPPANCAISGFKIEKKTMTRIFSRHRKHVREHLPDSDYSEDSDVGDGDAWENKPEYKRQVKELKRNCDLGHRLDFGNYKGPKVQFKQRPIEKDKGLLVVKASSAGFAAGNFAKITLNTIYTKKEPNENDGYRGLHIVIINPKTGYVEIAKVFDTYKSSKAFEEFITNKYIVVPEGYIVVAACADDCTKNLSARSK